DAPCDPTAPTAALACVHTNNTAACNDNNACTDVDACVGGKCVGTLSAAAQLCNAGDGNICNGVEFCNTATGACDQSTAPPCVSTACQSAVCDPINGCIVTNLNGLCDDGNACTSGDECVNGRCLGAPPAQALACAGGTGCTGVSSCDPATGACVTAAPVSCDDGDGCTTDVCDPVTGCSNPTIDGLPGALCEIDVILDQLGGPPPGSFRGVRLRRQLQDVALRARVNGEVARPGRHPQ